MDHAGGQTTIMWRIQYSIDIKNDQNGRPVLSFIYPNEETLEYKKNYIKQKSTYNNLVISA